jgi:hypothetical protein
MKGWIWSGPLKDWLAARFVRQTSSIPGKHLLSSLSFPSVLTNYIVVLCAMKYKHTYVLDNSEVMKEGERLSQSFVPIGVLRWTVVLG